jgi:hypothetical protein
MLIERNNEVGEKLKYEGSYFEWVKWEIIYAWKEIYKVFSFSCFISLAEFNFELGVLQSDLCKINIKFPFHLLFKRTEKYIFCFVPFKKLLEKTNKGIEIEIEWNSLFRTGFYIEKTIHRSHFGSIVKIYLLGFEFLFRFYDGRHWDRKVGVMEGD